MTECSLIMRAAADRVLAELAESLRRLRERVEGPGFLMLILLLRAQFSRGSQV
jgi:hypothetical protein